MIGCTGLSNFLGHWPAINGNVRNGITSASLLQLQLHQGISERFSKSGQSGLLAYGCINCVYYVVATLLAYNLVPPSNSLTVRSAAYSKIKYALVYMGKLASVVWLGSQATKAFRIWAAIAVSPIADKALVMVGHRKKISRDKSFKLVVAAILTSFTIFYFSLLLALCFSSKLS
jgi:hypothetical protein